MPFSLPSPASPKGPQDSQERPLTVCLKHKDFELAFLLLTKGADPRCISLTEGDTPLHAALHIFLDLKGRPLFCKHCFSGGGSWILELMLCSLVFPMEKNNHLEEAHFLARRICPGPPPTGVMGRRDHHGEQSGWVDQGDS